MFALIAENLATIVVGAMVLAVVALVVIKLIRDKKQRKHSCACGSSCKDCPSAGLCRK